MAAIDVESTVVGSFCIAIGVDPDLPPVAVCSPDHVGELLRRVVRLAAGLSPQVRIASEPYPCLVRSVGPCLDAGDPQQVVAEPRP